MYEIICDRTINGMRVAMIRWHKSNLTTGCQNYADICHNGSIIEKMKVMK